MKRNACLADIAVKSPGIAKWAWAIVKMLGVPRERIKRLRAQDLTDNR